MKTLKDLALTRLRRLRWMALAEGATLLALVCIAVPLKHLVGYPKAVSVMGPIHGAAFLLYFWMLINAVFSDDWTNGEMARMAVASFVPFGTFLSAGLLRRKEAQLAASTTQATTA